MIQGLGNNLIGPAKSGPSSVGQAGGSSFAEMLKGQLGEVAKMQQDASTAVEKAATGQTDDVAGVMAAAEKSEMAFKTLLAIRAKLMDAFDEIKNMPI
jgi:flagellar hook-basal body complex protein FliE